MAPQFVAVAMKSLYAPVGVEIPLEGVTLNKQLFDATAIAKKVGVMSRSGKPHAHAISAIIAQVDVLPEEKELAPFRAPSAATPERTCSTRSRSLPRSACGWSATITRKVLSTGARSTRCGIVRQHKYPILFTVLPVNGDFCFSSVEIQP